MNEDAYYDRLLREYDRDVWADLEREAEERLAAGDIACDRWRDDGMMIVIIIAAIALTALTASLTGGTGSCTDYYAGYYRSMDKLRNK